MTFQLSNYCFHQKKDPYANICKVRDRPKSKVRDSIVTTFKSSRSKCNLLYLILGREGKKNAYARYLKTRKKRKYQKMVQNTWNKASPNHTWNIPRLIKALRKLIFTGTRKKISRKEKNK